MKKTPKTPPPKDEKTPFQRFEELAKQIVSVPKREVDKRAQKRKSQ
jgi:hypothetical protein